MKKRQRFSNSNSDANYPSSKIKYKKTGTDTEAVPVDKDSALGNDSELVSLTQ